MLAMNAIQASAFTDPLTVKTQEEAPLGPPQDVNAETVGTDELLITWKPPLSDTWNGDILGYAIHWNLHGASHVDTNNTNSITVRGLTTTELRLKELKRFTTYDIYIQAFNSMGSGPKSSAVTVTTQEGVPEAAPQNVTCSPLSSQSVKVKWSPPPTQHHGGVIQGYKVVYKPVMTDSDLQAAGSEVKRTSSLETYLHGLLKFTNYSIRLLAYTSVGDGILSSSVFCNTEQDVPGPPAFVKALSLTSDSILVSWMPPEHPNGIITQYSVYCNEKNSPQKQASFQAGPTIRTHEVRGLKELEQYEFWVTASTIVGEGDPTRPVLQAPNSRAPARIASFSQVLRRALKTSVTMSCLAVGNPTPSVRWLHKKRTLKSDSGFKISQGLLHITRLEEVNEGNYSCIAKNLFGEDQITYQVIVLMPPDTPVLEILGSDHHTIKLQWTTPKDGGTPILGYILNYKRDHGNWQYVQLDAEKNSHTLETLHCGATYHAYIVAHNRVGDSQPSDTVSTSTKGTEPELPNFNSLVLANATSLYLYLSTWPDGGCPMLYFVVEYRILGSGSHWILVDNNVPPKKFLIGDLQPATWYQLRLTAHNSAGSTRVHFNIATTTVTGATVAPMQESQSLTNTSRFYEDVYVIVPTVCSAVFLLSAGLLLYVTLNRTRCRQCIEQKRAQGMPESPSACKAAAEMDNRRNFQQIYSASPTKTDEHQAPKRMDESSELYEMSPYATFAVPSESHRKINAATLDYTMQFRTFGHTENDSSAQLQHTHRANKKNWYLVSDGDNEQQALTGSLHRKSNVKRHHSKVDMSQNSESDTSGSPSAVSSYRVPIKQPTARSLEIYRLDSSTESNETSPVPHRRHTPQHYSVCSSKRGKQSLAR